MLARKVVSKYTTKLNERKRRCDRASCRSRAKRVKAQVYVFLLSHKPMTAYGVARQIGKATANTYKAIESLARRGAVLVEDGDNRQCRAVPVESSWRTWNVRFPSVRAQRSKHWHRSSSRRMTSAYTKWNQSHNCWSAAGNDRERAERLITVDAFPNALERIAPDLRDAASRGIAVYVQAYAPIEIEGAHIIVAPMGREAAAYWNSQQLNLVIDGRETLIALLDNELTQIHQALWSNSLYLSCLMHAGMTSEQTIHRLLEARTASDAHRSIHAVLDEHRFFLNTDVPGQKELFARFVPTERA